MQKNVGPLTPTQIAALADLLQSKDVQARIAKAQTFLAKERVATVSPGVPAIGRALFLGEERLANGGLPCASCHSAAGQGGSFAVDLTGVFARRGRSKLSLESAIQTAGFPVMHAVFHAHPVTAQEAVHLTAYFASLAGAGHGPGAKNHTTTAMVETVQPKHQRPPVGWAAMGIAAIFFAGLILFAQRQRPAGTRARLVQNSRRGRKTP